MASPSTTAVVLTGFMGTGKSTTGRVLASRLGYEFVDTDSVIVERHGPISDIFARCGEDGFRLIERELGRELAGRPRLVIATGGRMMLDPATIASLGRSSRVFCLVASAETIVARTSSDGAGPVRPLLAVEDPAGRVAELLAERRDLYRRFPRIDTDGLTPAEVADHLDRLVNRFPRSVVTGGRRVDVGPALWAEVGDASTPQTVVIDHPELKPLARLLSDRVVSPEDISALDGSVAVLGSARLAAEVMGRIDKRDRRDLVSHWPARIDDVVPLEASPAPRTVVELGFLQFFWPAPTCPLSGLAERADERLFDR